MICWVRSAILAARSVGSASASSKPLVCSDCVPPQTAANPWRATRTMLFSGCCAVSVTPPVWVWKRSRHERSSWAPNRSRMISAHIRRAARNFATSWKTLLWPLKKKASRGAELVDLEPGVERRLHVGDPVGERERDLLDGRAALLAEVVAADRDRVPLRDPFVAVREQIGGQADRALGRIDEVAAGDVLLEDVVLGRAAQLFGRHPLLLADQLVQQQQHRSPAR